MELPEGNETNPAHCANSVLALVDMLEQADGASAGFEHMDNGHRIAIAHAIQLLMVPVCYALETAEIEAQKNLHICNLGKQA